MLQEEVNPTAGPNHPHPLPWLRPIQLVLLGLQEFHRHLVTLFSEGDEDMAVVVVDKAGDEQFISSP